MFVYNLNQVSNSVPLQSHSNEEKTHIAQPSSSPFWRRQPESQPFYNIQESETYPKHFTWSAPAPATTALKGCSKSSSGTAKCDLLAPCPPAVGTHTSTVEEQQALPGGVTRAVLACWCLAMEYCRSKQSLKLQSPSFSSTSPILILPQNYPDFSRQRRKKRIRRRNSSL